MKRLKMFKTTMKILAINLIAVAGAFSITSFGNENINISKAAFQPVSRNVCALVVHPFNASAQGSDILPYTAQGWFNKYKQGDSLCDNFLKYANKQYSQPPKKENLPLPNKNDIEKKSMPETTHTHIFYNDSVQDNYYYRSFTDSFQIILGADTLKNTDLDKLVCYTPTPNGASPVVTPGCTGNLSQWGGTELTFNKTTGVINWKFATSGNGRPMLNGDNSDLNPNFSNQDYRKLPFSVKLTSKNNSGEVWTASTISRTLTRHQSILKSAVTDKSKAHDIGHCSNDGKVNSSYNYNFWCTLPNDRIGSTGKIEQLNVINYSVNGKNYSTGGKNYFWSQVGAVATAWRQTEPVNPPKLCLDLQWDGAFRKQNAQGQFVTLANDPTPNLLNVSQQGRLYVKPTYTQGTGPQRALEYHWVAFNSENTRPSWFTNNDKYNLPIFFSGMSSLLSFQNSVAVPKAYAQGVIIPNQNLLLSLVGKFNNIKSNNSPSDSSNKNPYFGQNVYYSGGIAGTTVGVQAFYADGQNVPGAGPMVTTPKGELKQKAENCHLEFKIPENPAICRDLTIQNKPAIISSVNEGERVALTVAPSFTPAGSSVGLIYEWNASNGTFFQNASGGTSLGSTNVRTSNTTIYFERTSDSAATNITVQAYSTDNNLFPPCADELKIPPQDQELVCELLDMDYYLFNGRLALNQVDEMEVGNKYQLRVNQANSVNTDGSPIKNYTINLSNEEATVENGQSIRGRLTPASTNPTYCPPVPSMAMFEAPVDCAYDYTPLAGDTITFTAENDNGVPACKITENFNEDVQDPICEALNLRQNGSAVTNPLTTSPGQTYSFSANPKRTDNSLINTTSWTVSGGGALTHNIANLAAYPDCHLGTDTLRNATIHKPSYCVYNYTASNQANVESGLQVRANPDDGVAACSVQTGVINPPITDDKYCVGLDLSYIPRPFDPTGNTFMQARVRLSDGSKYESTVTFRSSPNQGTFNGNSSPFAAPVGDDNRTGIVNYAGGNENTELQVYITDRALDRYGLCYKQLLPEPEETEICEVPPNIEYEGDNTYCVDNYGNTGTAKSLCWNIYGGTFFNGSTTARGKCVTVDDSSKNFTLTVEDCDPAYRNYCYDQIRETTEEEDEEPNLEKRVAKIGSSGSIGPYSRNVSFSTTGASNNDQVAYQIKFEPNSLTNNSEKVLNARIFDPAFDGQLQGYKYKDDNRRDGFEGSIVDINLNGLKVRQGSRDINKCSNGNKHTILESNSTCWRMENSSEFVRSDNTNGAYLAIYNIQSNDPIYVEYKGTINRGQSGLNIKDCQEGTFCQERFYNQSYVTDFEYCEYTESTDEDGNTTRDWDCEPIVKENNRCEYYINGKGERVRVNGDDQDCKDESYTVATPPTYVELVCQYFLTRASGDVFLEDTLNYGIDVSKCYPFRNTTSTIVKPIPPEDREVIATGAGDENTFTISNEICKAGQDNFASLSITSDQKDALTKLYGADIANNLSSTICEVGLVPGAEWTKASINNAITTNIGKLTRWMANPKGSDEIADLNNLSAINYYRGNGTNEKVTLKALTGNDLVLTEGSGAKTIIVEDADLYINSNIKYGTSSEAIPQNQIASLAFIVINGNIYVDNDVTELAGAYFAHRTDEDEFTVGNIVAAQNNGPTIEYSEVPLTIYGSIYGNVAGLFERRVASGDIGQDQGAITIRYDQRMMLNTPPGLSDLFGDFSQSQVAR